MITDLELPICCGSVLTILIIANDAYKSRNHVSISLLFHKGYLMTLSHFLFVNPAFLIELFGQKCDRRTALRVLC